MSELESPTAPTDPEPGSPSGSGASRKSTLFIVFLVVFIDLLGFGIVLPLLPRYAKHLLEPLFPGDENRWIRGPLLGILMASFSLMQFVFAPVWGRISDRIGRRPILLMGLAGSVIFYLLFGLASDWGQEGHAAQALILIFVARIGAGMAGATISTAQAVIADCTPPGQRARGMALIGAAFGIGFTFGPLLGFLSRAREFSREGVPGYAAAILSLIALILAVFLLPETLREGFARARRHWLNWASIRDVLRTPAIGKLVVMFFVATVAFASLESTLALISDVLLNPAEAAHGIRSADVSRTNDRENFLLFSYVGFILMIVQGLFYRRLVNRVGEVRFLRTGILFMMLGLAGVIAVLLLIFTRVLTTAGAVIPLSLLILTVVVTGFAVMTPSLQSLISRRGDQDRQGEILGVNQSGSALARILGPLFSTSLFEVDRSHLAPYVLGTILMLGAYLMARRVEPD